MRVDHLWLRDFRNYAAAELVPAPTGLTVIEGGNGQGKTNLLEALGYIATARSFRGAPREALIRRGAERAVLRAEVVREGRAALVEAELNIRGRERLQVNRRPLRRFSELAGVLKVSVFSPDDLSLVKGGPAGRRHYLDETLVSLRPSIERLRGDAEHILRQRNVLLRQAGGRSTASILATLDVWDSQLARVGDQLVEHRRSLVSRLAPLVAASYARLAGESEHPALLYRASWTGELAEALAASRGEDLRRGITTVGPQRDELELTLTRGGGRENGGREAGGGERVPLPARTHASQGEQRSLALALRLAAHALAIEDNGDAPVLLLDDVFSELDDARSAELMRLLPDGQAVLTTVGALPPGAQPAAVMRVEAASVLPEPRQARQISVARSC
ncbi:MAG: DNA replication/repair protein RecF [Acidimicrobiales bacterium]